MTAGVLDVLIAGKLAGTLSQDGAGSLSFAYERGYRGVPLSSSMPLSTRPYRDKVVLPYLWGLLPEDPAARRHVAADAGISPNNPFALLGVIGLDCPGAVQFVPQGSDAYRDERLVAVSDAEIARRLAMGRQDDAGWIASNEHWSLGGQQSKFALRRMDGRWYSCEGSEATTNIPKSGVRGLAHQALNEYVCMRLATSLDVPAASVEYLEFEGESGMEPAIVIERYDRLVEGHNVTRLHQEDLCQTLGCLPDCTDKMIIGDIERAIGASYELRNKKDLIEAFIDSLGSSNDVTADWEKYLAEAKKRELSAIIEEEALDDMATREFMANAFVDGGVPESGTEMASLMTRKPSRFAPANAYAEMKARMLDKLKGFFDRFNGLGR